MLQLRLFTMLLVGMVVGYGAAVFTWADVHQYLYAWNKPGSASSETVGRAEQPPQAQTPVRLSSGEETIPIGRNGHAQGPVEINGRRMEVIFDTGASSVVLRESDARRAGYRFSPSDFTYEANTANGVGLFAPVLLHEVEVGSIRVRDVQAFVARDEDLWMNLLGMSFLGRLEGFRFEGDRLVLEN